MNAPILVHHHQTLGCAASAPSPVPPELTRRHFLEIGAEIGAVAALAACSGVLAGEEADVCTYTDRPLSIRMESQGDATCLAGLLAATKAWSAAMHAPIVLDGPGDIVITTGDPPGASGGYATYRYTDCGGGKGLESGTITVDLERITFGIRDWVADGYFTCACDFWTRFFVHELGHILLGTDAHTVDVPSTMNQSLESCLPYLDADTQSHLAVRIQEGWLAKFGV